MNVIEYFGPRIAKTKLSQIETDILFDICQQSTSAHNTDSVGYLPNYCPITDKLQNSTIYDVILKHVEDYVRTIDSGMWANIINSDIPVKNLINLSTAWYSKQCALQFTPPHIHRKTGDLVCVIFPKISLDNPVDANYNNDKTAIGRLLSSPGQLIFKYGEILDNDFGQAIIAVQPEECDIYIFPATLWHYTIPVLGNSIRYSVSCNFSFTQIAHKFNKTMKKNED